MKLLKTSIYVLASIVMLSSCGNNNETEEKGSGDAKTTEATNNTPLGQASVVDETSDPNILQVAIGSKDHSTLVAAVQAAQIEHVLANAGPLTVFAPVNAAFDAQYAP